MVLNNYNIICMKKYTSKTRYKQYDHDYNLILKLQLLKKFINRVTNSFFYKIKLLSNVLNL